MLKLTNADYAALRRHGEETYPYECCGVLLGRMRRAAPMPSGLALRLFNEAALLLVVPIILLAVVKPF